MLRDNLPLVFLLAGFIWLAMLFAQLKLFAIASTLERILEELQKNGR